MCDPKFVSSESVVLFDGYCSLCRASQRVVDRFDWLRLIRWLPFQEPEASRYGITRDALEARMYLVRGSKRWSGFAAWKQILLRLPVVWLLIAGSVCLSPYLLLLWVAFLLPLTEPAGERVYDWVARNRYKLPGSTCRFDP